MTSLRVLHFFFWTISYFALLLCLPSSSALLRPMLSVCSRCATSREKSVADLKAVALVAAMAGIPTGNLNLASPRRHAPLAPACRCWPEINPFVGTLVLLSRYSGCGQRNELLRARGTESKREAQGGEYLSGKIASTSPTPRGGARC
ncbi:hypothetical protein C8R47DRAFT_1197557 [Mycena vitilis]|nr:hypothetical protein C8R47DRAFT_1197557 [Mycena vitilis]